MPLLPLALITVINKNLGLPQSSTARLQMVQNAAARLSTTAKKTNHVT